MGFDNECIVNIQTLSGEYFCPVCRLLVYPNEAIQSQCTHLYCKPCLTYVVGTTSACPYDGYLVTEADSKPLIESNKALAETIGNIPVHCLYHRSGCTWQGPLSECTSHCSGCAFGNSPVVCNRCGVQIVHRQVQEHAQSCSGVQIQMQQALGGQDTLATGTASATADPSQTAGQSVTPSSLAQVSQTAAAPPPGQDPKQQSIGNPQAVQAVALAAAPASEQWYQQQYQQYYQQYPGYDPYQQTYQHSYPYQQQAVQPYQQHVPGPHQPQAYAQPQLQSQPQAQIQPQAQVQPQPRPHQQVHPPVQPPTQTQSQTHPPHGHPHHQPQPQPYPQGQPISQPHTVQPHPQHVQMPQYQLPPPQMQHPQLPIQPQPHPQVHPHTQPHHQPPAHSLAQPQGLVQQNPHSLPPTLQPNQPINTNAHPQTQHPPAHSVTGHQSYPQPQAVQQMQLGAPQQHPMQLHVHGGPPPQMHNQFPQQPPQMRPAQSHVPVQSQQYSASLPLQGQVPPSAHAQQPMLHPHTPQPVQQRPVMQPQQFVQQPFPGQTSGPNQNQLHQQAHLMQPPPPPPIPSHLRPPPHSFPQSQPHQSQNYVGRPLMPNQGAQPHPFQQPNSGFTGPAQVRPMQLCANQQSVNLNNLPRADHPPHVSSEQNVQSGIALKHTMQEATAKTDTNVLVPTGLGADTVEAKALKSASDLKFLDNEQKPRGGDTDDTCRVDTLAKDTDSKLHAVENGSGEPAIKPMVKKEATEGTVEPDIVVEEQKDSTNLLKPVDPSSVDSSSLHQSEFLEEHDVKLPKDAVDNAMPVLTGADKGSQDISLAPTHAHDSSVYNVAAQGNSQTPSAHGFQERNMGQSQIPHSVPFSDQGRYQQPPMHYGPYTHQQRPTAPSITQPGPPPRPLYHGHVPGQVPPILRPQGPGELSHLGQPLNPSEHFHTPAKQPYGSFPPEGPAGRNFGPGSTSSFGRGPTHFGPPQGGFEMQSSAPLGNYGHGPMPPLHVGGGPPPGAFDSHGAIIERAPPHGPEGHFVQHRSNSEMEAEIFPEQRPHNFDGRRIDSHLPGTWEKGPFGPPPGIDSNTVRMKRAPGVDSPSTLGYGDERFKPPPEEHLNPFPLEPGRRLERGSRPLDKPPLGDNYDSGSGGAPSRFLPPYHSPGTFHPNEAGERARPFGRHQMDHLASRSPGREYPDIPPRGFGSLSGDPRRQSGADDIDGRDPRPFGEGARPFNMPLDPVGNSFHGSRFPLSPSHLRRGELDGHLRFGDPSGFGGFPVRARMGELGGPGSLPHHLPFGESFGGNKSSHPRLGEPGFRSSYSLQGFPNDGGFFASSMGSFDNSRKRKPTSMGWCRICRVDCETVEGLDMHSQMREHQKKAMEMVLNIKQQNAKRQKKSNDHSSRDEASKSRSAAAYHGRGTKA